MDRVMEVEINIPTNNHKKFNFNIDKQKIIAKKYTNLYNLKRKIKEKYNKFKNIKPVFDINDFKRKDIAIIEIFDIYRGNSKYKKSYILNNKGKYPVYSSQTSNFGIFGEIATYDFDGKFISWTTDGAYAGTVFLRNGKFSMTSHCASLKIKENLKEIISIEYIYHYFINTLRKYAIGEDNKRITIEMMKTITVPIPINKNGGFDINKQNEIYENYATLLKIKDDILSRFNTIKHKDILLSED